MKIRLHGMTPDPVELHGYVGEYFDEPMPRFWHRIVWVGITETEFECQAAHIRFNIRVNHGSETYKALDALRPTIESPFSITPREENPHTFGQVEGPTRSAP